MITPTYEHKSPLQTIDNEHMVDIKEILLPPENISDESIVTQINKGNAQAYASIMRRYNQRMFRIARSIVSDDAAAMDIVQEAHIKAFTNLSELRGHSTFVAWLCTITRNEALSYLRRHKREIIMADADVHAIKDRQDASGILSGTIPNNAPDQSLEGCQLKSLINDNMDSLPADFRIVFVLRAIEQLSVKDTAEILGIKEETVKTRYFRAKRLIREKIQIHLDQIGMQVYEFGGSHCDVIVENVIKLIQPRPETVR